MAHFAELDNNNKVIRTVVIDNKDCQDANGNEAESIGIAFCQKLWGGNWIQTSYNKNFRKHFAGAEFTYDADLDAFIEPKPYDSWVLDEHCYWQPPVACPTDGKKYAWNETSISWDEITE